jgi:hypothetical protein
MGVARLLAKGWVVFCLFAGGYALHGALGADTPFLRVLPGTLISVVLFGAMGLLFIGGYAAASSGGGISLIGRLKPRHVLPSFNELVFVGFALAIFIVQTLYLPDHVQGGLLGALQAAIAFAVPGQDQLRTALGACGIDGGRMFAAAFAWLLTFVFLGSGLSRIRLAAGIVRLERKQHPEALGPTGLALVLGLAAVVGIQLLYIGSLYPLLPCTAVQGITGDMLIGIAPLMLAYLIFAALTNLLALGPEA